MKPSVPQLVWARLEATPESVRALAARLCAGERERAARFRFERDRRRFVVARARLRELLGARLGAAPEAIEFVYGRRGKPALADPYAQSGWRFNLSHCEEVALYAFAQGCEIGVDLEALRPLPEAAEIAARHFSARENQAFLALPAHARTLGFFRCWTRKEAVAKALGEGLAMPLQAFDVSLAPGEPPAVLRMRGEPGDGGWRLADVGPLPGFVAAVALHQG